MRRSSPFPSPTSRRPWWRRDLARCVGAVALALVVTAAQADSLSDSLTRQLRAQGFTEVEVSRTWLGRLRVEARNDRMHREIVVNPNTGEILRDYTHAADGNDDPTFGIQLGGQAAGVTTGGSAPDQGEGDSDGDSGDGDGGDGDGGDGDGGDGDDD